MKITSSAALALCLLLVALVNYALAFQTTTSTFSAGHLALKRQRYQQVGRTVPATINNDMTSFQKIHLRHDVSLHETSAEAAASINITSASSSEKNSNKAVKPLSNNFFSVLWRFTRPHTIIGSALAIPALHLLAAPSYAAAFTTKSLTSMVYAMVPALFMNLYITGLNQITDVDIDKINKPDLPIAAGDLSMRNAIVTVVVSLMASLFIGVAAPTTFATNGLNVALWYSAILGTLYSLPPFRLKRFPFLAAFCIVAVRGAVINAGFFAHAQVAAYGMTTSVWQCLLNDPRCWMSSLYFAVFGVVIALMKDVPDVKGDEESNVRTFSVRLGPKRVYKWMRQLLTGLFWGVGVAFFRGAAVGAATDSVWTKGARLVVGLCSVFAGYSVQKEGAPVDPENPREVYGFYMYLWKLFYLSYLVLPLAR